MATLRVGDPLDKSTDIGAIVADVQLDRIRALVEQGQGGRRRLLSAGQRSAGQGPVLSADACDRPLARLDPGAGGDFWAGARLDDVPHAGRGAGARQQFPLRPRRLRLVGIDQRHARRGGARESRRRLDQLHQPLRRRRRLRRLSRIRLRPRGWARRPFRISRPGEGQGERQGAAGLEGRLHDLARSARLRRRARHRPHRENVHRRQAGATRFRLQLHRPRRERRLRRAGRPRQSQGCAERRRGGRRRRRLEHAPPRTIARRCSTTSPKISPPAPTSSARACKRWRTLRRKAPQPKSRRQSSAASTTQRKPTNTTARCTRRARVM